MACLVRRQRRTAAHNSKRDNDTCLSGVTFVLAVMRLTTRESFNLVLRYTTAEYARSEASEKPWTSRWMQEGSRLIQRGTRICSSTGI